MKAFYYLNFMCLIGSSLFVSCSSSTAERENHLNEIRTKVALKQADKMFDQLTLENRFSKEQIALGKMLYMDNRLSKDNTQSCNTCHNVNTFGVDHEVTSLGNDGMRGGRNSPTTFNAALHFRQFWDGREPTIESQAGQPILNPVEMAMPNRDYVVNRLRAIPEYQEAFAEAFPGQASPITYANLENAIGAYERQLITPGKLDEFLNGETYALTLQEQRGLRTFVNVGCASCHNGALLGGNSYQKFGVFHDYWEHTGSDSIDNGRHDFTKEEADRHMFKTPTLRNVSETHPYFHDGSVEDLKVAIRIMGKVQLNKNLSQQEVDDIAAFLEALKADVPKEVK